MMYAESKAKKVLKIIRNILIVLLCVLILFLGIVFAVHKILSSQERALLEQAGYYHLISVGEYNLNVQLYGKENGRHTIVGVSGMGSSDFAVRVKPLMDRFADENRIAVIDRAGYGMSDDTHIAQTTERIVSDYRTALKNAGCQAPYVLVGHSLGGDYITYWESVYPDEVEAVVYLDPNNVLGDISMVDSHEGVEVWWEDDGESFENSVNAVFNKMGIIRLYLAVTGQSLWENMYGENGEEYRKAFCENSVVTFAQNSEESCSAENMKKTNAAIQKNDIPKLYIDAEYYTKEDMIAYFSFLYNSGMTNFVEDINPDNEESMNTLWENNSKVNQENYERFIKPYYEKLGNCTYVNIPGDHYIFEYNTDEVEKAIKELLNQTEK